MSKKTRSIKGVMVDFDLIRIKQQIAAAPAPVNVSEREAFIDKKIRRRVKKAKTATTELDIDATILEEMAEDVLEELPLQSIPTPATPTDAQPRQVRKRKEQ